MINRCYGLYDALADMDRFDIADGYDGEELYERVDDFLRDMASKFYDICVDTDELIKIWLGD